MNRYINNNGALTPAGQPVLRATNRGYRYGDGLFETMRLVNGKIRLQDLHFERLFHGLNTLEIDPPAGFDRESLAGQILELARKNDCVQSARVRLSVCRGEGGIYDEPGLPQYLIECDLLNATVGQWKEKGLVIDVFPDTLKSIDKYSNLKSANYLPYVMAGKHALKNGLDDCLLLNMHGRICDATIANVFWIKNGNVHTVPLSEGCVAGVMRRFLVERLTVQEKQLLVEELEEAEELFLTNAVHGIRWVEKFRGHRFSNDGVRNIFKDKEPGFAGLL